VNAGLLILIGGLLIIGAVIAVLARAFLPRAKGTHAGPREPARLLPQHPRAMFGPGIDGPSVPLHMPPAERRH
jgi:hypothetical protein